MVACGNRNNVVVDIGGNRIRKFSEIWEYQGARIAHKVVIADELLNIRVRIAVER